MTTQIYQEYTKFLRGNRLYSIAINGDLYFYLKDLVDILEVSPDIILSSPATCAGILTIEKDKLDIWKERDIRCAKDVFDEDQTTKLQLISEWDTAILCSKSKVVNTDPYRDVVGWIQKQIWDARRDFIKLLGDRINEKLIWCQHYLNDLI